MTLACPDERGHSKTLGADANNAELVRNIDKIIRQNKDVIRVTDEAVEP